MATVENLYQFEDQLESAIATVLNAGGVTSYVQRQDVELATPFVAVQCRIGEVQGYQAFSELVVRPVAWRFAISLKITTNRHIDILDPHHISWRAKIRHLMYGYQTSFLSSILPYHEIGEMTETGTSASVIPDMDFDVSEIAFQSCFAIREAYRSLLAT